MTDTEAPLASVATLVMGQSPSGSSYNSQRRGVPLLNGPTEFGPIHPDPAQWTTEAVRMCEPGDLLFCVRGATAGRLNVADQPYCIGRGIAALRCDSEIDQTYLKYALQRQVPQLLAGAAGSVFPNISRSDLARLTIPWPAEPDRSATGSRFALLDRQFAAAHTVAEAAERLAIAAMSRAGEDTPAAPLSSQVVATRLLTDPRQLAPDSPVEHYSLPSFDSHGAPEETTASTIKSLKLRVEPGAVLVSRLNPRIPRVWLVDRPQDTAMCSTEFLVLYPRDGLTQEDVWALCASPRFLIELQARVTGTSGSHQRVSWEDALSIDVLDPSQADPVLRQTWQLSLRRMVAARRAVAETARLRDSAVRRWVPVLGEGDDL